VNTHLIIIIIIIAIFLRLTSCTHGNDSRLFWEVK